MSDALPPERRAALVALLQERAQRLALDPAVIARALERCHTARVPQPARGGAATPTTTAPATTGMTAGAGPAAPERAPAPTAVAAGVATPSGAGDDGGTRDGADDARRTGAQEDAGSAGTLADSQVPQAPVATGEGIPPGRIIAGYRIESLLGKGGMGQVYRAVQLSVQRPVAFKVLARRLAANPSFRERFLREARSAGRLHHYHLITVHDVGEADGLMFFSMELVDGRTVRDLLAKGPLPALQAVDIAIQTLRALAYAHEQGIIHRDIKPDNLMVTPAGVVKVADLGLSRVAAEDAERATIESTQAGTIMGTPHYMPPEQTRDAHAVDARSDLYAVGATLYHLLCGRPPFTGRSAVEVVMRAASEPLTFPTPGPDPELQAVLERLLAKRPEDRYASATQAIEALEAARDALLPPSARRSQRTQLRQVRRRRLGRWLRSPLVTLLAALVVLAVVLALVLGGGHRLDPAERQRIADLIDASEFRAAIARIDLDAATVRPQSPAALALGTLRDQAIAGWNLASMDTVMHVESRVQDAVRAHRLQEASQALHLEDESALSPAALERLQRDRDEFEKMLTNAIEPNTDPDQADAVLRMLQAREAMLLWNRLLPTAGSRVGGIDLGERFSGDGEAQLSILGRSQALWTRGVTLRVTFATTAADSHWDLSLGEARFEVRPGGATLAISGVVCARTGAGEAVLRLRRRFTTIEVALGSGTWFDAALNREAMAHLSWQLGHDGQAQVLTAISER